jgi:hypothetical protein
VSTTRPTQLLAQSTAEEAEVLANQAGEPGAVPAPQDAAFVCGTGLPRIIYFSDFEGDDGGWIVGGFGDWERGAVTTGVFEFCDTAPRPEPPGAFSGNEVWANNLDGCYQNAPALKVC